MQKSADAFRTISEVADDLSLPQHVLRFWETRFPQVRPLKRAGGRRYYRPGDVSLLKAIRQLLYDDGYTIKGVQRLLKEQGARGVSAGAAPSEVDLNGAGDEDSTDDAEGYAEEVPPVAACPSVERDDPGRSKYSAIGGSSLSVQRAALAEALATVEECRRLLDALRISAS